MERPFSAAADISVQLSHSALAVCRHYLPAGRREGQYWTVGNVSGEPGRSLYVRLFSSGRGKAGNWTDAATGEHGDLLDLIRLNRCHIRLADALDEARQFLRLPPSPRPEAAGVRSRRKPRAPGAATRLFSAAHPLSGTLGATYLKSRGITRLNGLAALRYHPRCYYRPSDTDPSGTPQAFPALVASVTNTQGVLTGIHRTWLELRGIAKAPVATPRRALGNILGHAIRFGSCETFLAAGEGIETMLSLREALPSMPVAAATSSSHLAAIAFPPGLVRLYVARDRDAAGDAAFGVLTQRAAQAGIDLVSLMPRLGDFNDDLLDMGPAKLADQLLDQLCASDRAICKGQ